MVLYIPGGAGFLPSTVSLLSFGKFATGDIHTIIPFISRNGYSTRTPRVERKLFSFFDESSCGP